MMRGLRTSRGFALDAARRGGCAMLARTALWLVAALAGSGAQPAAAQQWTDSGFEPPAIARTLEPWHGDLPGMRERRRVRALVVQDRTGFFIDRGRPRGFEVEL